MNEIAHAGEINDFRIFLRHFFRRVPHDGATQLDVFHAGQLIAKTRSQLQICDAALGQNLPFIRRVGVGNGTKQGAFTRAIRADQPQNFATFNF